MTQFRQFTGEFGRIAQFLKPLSRGRFGAFGLQDDAATLTSQAGYDWVVTTDQIVAGVHFLGSETPVQLADKLMAVNLSDLAACGAEPDAGFLTLCLPKYIDDDWLSAFAEQLMVWLNRYNFAIMGGDSTATSGPMVLGLTLMGKVPTDQHLTRLGAKAGDLLVVSGTIGDGYAGLQIAEGKIKSESFDILKARYFQPQPRLSLGWALRDVAHAAMDISDGLLADTVKMAAASNLKAVIDLPSIPLSPASLQLVQQGSLAKMDLLTGGDDYELLFALPPARRSSLTSLAKQSGVSLSVIGFFEDGVGLLLKDSNGPVALPEKLGFCHD